jgi:hypothetical protein
MEKVCKVALETNNHVLLPCLYLKLEVTLCQCEGYYLCAIMGLSKEKSVCVILLSVENTLSLSLSLHTHMD